jgi:hypothetical protein
MKFSLFTLLFFFCTLTATIAQSPYRVFALDCHLDNEAERQTASLVTKAILLNAIDFVRASKRITPYAPMDWTAFQLVIDTLQKKIPLQSEWAWEEDYGLKTEGAKYEKWKELTFYYIDFPKNNNLKAIMKGKRKYVLQIRINIDNNAQIKSIEYVKGKKMIDREANILYAYKILYKP